MGNKEGYINKTGNFIIKPQFDDASSFSEGMAAVRTQPSGKYGFIDRSGRIVIQPKFDYAYWFNKGLAAVEVDESWGFIDKTGRFIFSMFQYLNFQ